MTQKNKNKDEEPILNGNKFVVHTYENTGKFERDAEKLFHQYANFRLSLYNQYKGYVPDKASREELKSYIDEQFIRLVKEYDLSSPVDFPGYIKKKLNYRVKLSYIKGEYRDRNRVFVPKNYDTVQYLIEQDPVDDEELDYYEALEYILRNLELNELEREVLYLILKELPDSQIEKEIKQKRKDLKVSNLTIRETIKKMNKVLKEELYRSLEQ